MSYDGLPDRRTTLRGVDADGSTVWVSHSISKKLYRCPGCRTEIPIGSDHALVRVVPPGEDPFHQHWHLICARRDLLPDLQNLDRRTAQEASLGNAPRLSRGARRCAALERRTKRPRL